MTAGAPLRLWSMYLKIALIYLSTLRRQLGIYTSSLLTMSVFIDFNSVLFLQYMCWAVPFIPLCVCDQMHSNNQNSQPPHPRGGG